MSKFFCRKKEPSTGEYMYFGSFFFNTTHINPVKSLRNIRVETDFWIISDIKERDGIENLFVFDTLSELEMNLNLYFRGIRKSKSYDKEIDNYVPDHYTIEPYEHWEKGIEIIECEYISDSIYKALDERDEMANYDYSSKQLFVLLETKQDNCKCINDFGDKKEREALVINKDKLVHDAAKLTCKILAKCSFEEIQKENSDEFKRVSHLLKNLLKFEYTTEFSKTNYLGETNKFKTVESYFSNTNRKEPIAYKIQELSTEKEFWILPVEITINSDTEDVDSIKGFIRIDSVDENENVLIVTFNATNMDDDKTFLKNVYISMIKKSDFEKIKSEKEKHGKTVELLNDDSDLAKFGITGKRFYSDIDKNFILGKKNKNTSQEYTCVDPELKPSKEPIKNPLIYKLIDAINNSKTSFTTTDDEDHPEQIIFSTIDTNEQCNSKDKPVESNNAVSQQLHCGG